MKKIHFDTYPDEIAEALVELIARTPKGSDETEPDAQALTDCIYDLKYTAENPYNSDYWRELYRALSFLPNTVREWKEEEQNR